MLTRNRELLVIVNPLRKQDVSKRTVAADKSKSGGGTTGGAAGNKAKEVVKIGAAKTTTVAETVKKKQDPQPGPSSPKSVEEPKPVQPVLLENGIVEGKSSSDGHGGVEAKAGSQNSRVTDLTNNAKCTCQCEKRVKVLEGEVSDLKNWKEGRKQFDDIISSWKEEVDKWMLSKFGFSVSLSSGSGGPPEFRNITATSAENAQKQSYVTLCPDSGKLIEKVIDVVVEEEPISFQNSGDVMEKDDPLALCAEDSVNVEITPDIFGLGHFLLDNYQDENQQSEEMMVDENEDDSDGSSEEEEGEVRGRSIVKTRLDRQIIKMRGDDEFKSDSDSDCYTVSEANSNTDQDSSSGDDFIPKGNLGRGRGRGKSIPSRRINSDTTQNSQGASTSMHNVQIDARKPKNSVLDLETRKELLKSCKPKPGNLWECNVCGFMLASLENMLLHVKYNHSTSAHTCPFCRIVVLCRSAKDAAVHQSHCKMRPSGTDGRVYVPKKSLKPVQQSAPRPPPSLKPVVPYKKNKVEDINAKVNKFIDDILEPNSKTAEMLLRKDKNKSNTTTTRPPAIVTLSSDEDDD